MQKLQVTRDARFASWCLSLLAVACLPVPAWCQEAKPATRPKPPEGCLLNPAPEFSQWTVAFSYPQDQPSAGSAARAEALSPNLIRKATVTKTREIVHEEMITVSGEKSDKWQTSKNYYVKPKGQTYWGECDAKFAKDNPTTDTRFLPLPANGFRDLDWISGDTYAGDITEHNSKYFVFIPASAGNVNVSDAAALKAQPVVAWIDAETRLPVIFKNRESTRQYTFATAPTEMQPFPPDLAREIKEGNEKRAKVFVTPHREY